MKIPFRVVGFVIHIYICIHSHHYVIMYVQNIHTKKLFFPPSPSPPRGTLGCMYVCMYHSWLKLSRKSANPTALNFQGNWPLNFF